MRWRPTLYLGRWSGVEIRLDLLVIGLIAVLFIVSFQDAEPGAAWSAVAHLGLLVALLFCMFLHELGHAMMCKMRGHQPSMILLSFVGLTFFKAVKARPRDEFWIALAGPTVNLAIALATAPFILVVASDRAAPPLLSQAGMASFSGFMAWLSLLNFSVAAINLLPGWPADGARALRGWMAKKWGYGAATVRAVAISHGFWLIVAGASVVVLTLAPMIKSWSGTRPSHSPASMIVMYTLLLIVFAMMGLYYGWVEKRRVARLGAERAAEVTGPPPEFMPASHERRKATGKIRDAEVVEDVDKQAEPPSEGRSRETAKLMLGAARATGKGAGWFMRKGAKAIAAMMEGDKEKPKP